MNQRLEARIAPLAMPATRVGGMRRVAFDTNALAGYGNQDLTPAAFAASPDGTELHLWGHTWKALDLVTIPGPTTLEADEKSGRYTVRPA